jgi:excisionase family DNA binding protein
MSIDEQIISLVAETVKKTLAESGSGPILSELLTIPETAKLLKVDKSTLYTWIREGRIAAINLGGEGGQSLRVHQAELARFIRECPKGH